jgi:hypothetical protein
MISAFMQESYRKTAEYNRLKARGDSDAASRYNRECLKEGLSYGKAGLKLFKGDIFGFLAEAKKGIDARLEQRRIVDDDK